MMLRQAEFLILGILVLSLAALARDDLADRPLDDVLALLAAEDVRVRADAAEALADRADARIANALRSHLAVETDFHAKLALHYALARHGERSSVHPLIEALGRTGHLGSVYLGWLAGRFARDHGWDQAAWKAWIDGVSDETWREWQRRRHLPWVASDADVAGLEAAIQWWNRLGYPDVGALPFVLVDAHLRCGLIPSVIEEGMEPEPPKGSPAWLLEDGEEAFRVFTHDLRTFMLRKGKPRFRPRQGTYERVDVGAFVREAIAASPRTRGGRAASDRESGTPSTEAGQWTASFWGDGDPMNLASYDPPDWFRAFVLAVACWKRDAKEPALAIWSRLALERPRGLPAPPWTTLDYLRSAMQEEEAEQLVEAFGDPALTTADLLLSHRTFLARFGPHEDAEARTRVLERMAREEEARRETPPKPWEAMTLEEQVEDLVWRLRESDTAYDLAAMRGRQDAPAEPSLLMRLVGVGYAAVPRLVRALSDDTLTRSTIYHDTGHAQWEGWRHVERVGDLALRALQRISGESFGAARDPFTIRMGGRGSIVDEGRVAEIRPRVEAWWAAFQEKGERAMLAEAVARGGRDAVEPARLLAVRHPDSATPALIAGIRATSYRWARDTLVALLPTVPGSETTTFLRAEVTENPSALDRIAAARALRVLGDPAGLEAMLREWPDLRNEDEEGGWSAFDTSEGRLLDFLASSGSVEAIRAIRRGIEDLPVGRRFAVVAAMRVAAGEERPFREAPPKPVPPEVLAEVEAVLLTLVLDEGEARGGIQMSGPGGRASEPCVGDVAAVALADLWPERHAFDAEASRAARRRARVEAANVGRAARGQPPLPLPPASAAPPSVSEAEAALLLDALLGAEDEAARAVATTAIVQAGLGMLPALLERLETIGEADPRRAVLDDLVHDLANRVVEVVFEEEGPEPDEALRSLGTSLEGRPLTGKAFVSLVLQVMRHTPPGATGARIGVRRDCDLSGVSLRLRLRSHRVFQPGTQKGWDVGQNLRVGGTGLVGSAGFLDLDYGRDAKVWARYAKALDRALARPVEEVIEGDVTVTLER